MWGSIIASLVGAVVGGVTNAVATANAIDKKIKGYNRCRHHDDPEKYITK